MIPKFPRRNEVSILNLPAPSGRSFRERLMAQGRQSENVTGPRHRYYEWDRYNFIDGTVLTLEGAIKELITRPGSPGLFGFQEKMAGAAAADREKIRQAQEAESRVERGIPVPSRPHIHSQEDEATILSRRFFAQQMARHANKQQSPRRRHGGPRA